jgi:hypothetical protein
MACNMSLPVHKGTPVKASYDGQKLIQGIIRIDGHTLPT